MKNASVCQLVTYSSDYRNAIATLIAQLDDWFEADAFDVIEPLLTPATTLLAVDDDDNLIGFVTVSYDQILARISWMGVSPQAHRQGIGRLLIQGIIDEAIKAKLTHIMVETMSDCVEYEPFDRTRQFYRSVGFTPHRHLGDLANNGLETTDWLFDLRNQPVEI